MLPPVMLRFLVRLISLGLTTVAILILVGLSLLLPSGRDEQDPQDRCSKWNRPHDMGLDEVARCAASGSVPAQVEYGKELHRAGRQEEAETWFEAAVAGSDTKYGKGNIAKNIASGFNPEPASTGRDDVRAAERWYRRSFDLGSNMAAVELGLMLRRVGDPNEADRWFEQAVERSGGNAAYDIAINLNARRNRLQGTDEAALAARWLRRGAELGDKESMSYYAKALHTGTGVKRSETEAFRWYEAAAQHPRAHAWDLLTLAELHADGRGTPPNQAAAIAALSAAKGKKLDDSDTTTPGKIKLLERRLNAAGMAKR